MASLAASFGHHYPSQYVMQTTHQRCCDNNTGQLSTHSPSRVCPCHLEQVFQVQQKMPAMPLSLMPRTTPSFPLPPDPSVMFGARDLSAVACSPLVRHDMKDMGTASLSSGWYMSPGRYPDQSAFERGYLACHGYGERYSPIDLNSGARRKNATRETTSTLKAWLYEHRKNPYPTKGEKIMLAILTKMTLTQVSTWFANARRRLKKENKMTWSPRNRCSDRKDNDDYSEDDEDEDIMNNGNMIDDDVDKIEEKSCFRTTTVIKSPEVSDRTEVPLREPVFSTTSTTTQSTSPSEDVKSESRVVPHPKRTQPTVIWTTRKEPLEETEKTRVQHILSLQDSPVKSLRKWVDGCFDTNRTTPVPDTPPQTPPCDTDGLSERVPAALKDDHYERKRNTQNNSPIAKNYDRISEENTMSRSMDCQDETTTNREIDAALALTTLFGTRS